MELPEQKLTRDYHHPYKAYDIQNDLMNIIYACIDEGKIGILESPTGTGKSLSLICASLTWLRDYQEKTLQGQVSKEDVSNEPAWVVEYARDEMQKAASKQRSALEARLETVRAKELRQKQQYESDGPEVKRPRVHKDKVTMDLSDVDEFELTEYTSDNEQKPNVAVHHDPCSTGLSLESQKLMEELGLVFQSSKDEDLLPMDEIKIFFCSRTHSQLTQFVQELRRVKLPEPTWLIKNDDVDTDKQLGSVSIKHLPLGSRKQLCINSEVSRLGTVQAINERCLDLQQPDTPKGQKCVFLPSKEKETLVNDFRDYTLAKVRDIEDLGRSGERIGTCPYYASRAAIKPSEIVTLPYPLLLQKSTRKALDLSLKGHVVIIDEAHNLMDSITNIHSIAVTRSQLKRCREQIGCYLQKFRNRLKGKNRVYVAQVVRLLDSISAYLDTRTEGAASAEGIVEIADLMAGKGVDQINLYKLVHYLHESKLARKVEGYVVHAEHDTMTKDTKLQAKSSSSTTSVLTHVQSFIETLTNPASEGRFFYGPDDQNELCLKYMLLDPTFHFREIVEEARAVILAGGTMSPMDDYTQHLFAYAEPSRIQTFSCGHIIPQENLLALPIPKGIGGRDFDFTFERRSLPATIENLGSSLIEISTVTPDGLIVFFPSYAYLDEVMTSWKSQTIWTRLQTLKPIFQESKSAGVDMTLASYSEAIAKGKGGLLLSVIGGKLSEGINFSDALGRGVVVVGMPYPNVHTAQWKAKLEYIERSTRTRSGSAEEGKAAARGFVENSCMRAVNQSIGRAIRHRGDYASIVLLDKRYRNERIMEKLPAWIRQGISDQGRPDIEDARNRLKSFFDGKRGS